MPRLVGLVILAIACNSSGTNDERGEEPEPSVTDGAAATVDAGPSEVSYPANEEGLETLIDELVAAHRSEDTERAYRLTESLRLRDHETWFADQFGPRLGSRLAKDYQRQRDDIELLAQALTELRAAGRGTTEIERFDSPADQKAVGYQSKALSRMKSNVPLYSARLQSADGKKTFHVWSFIHLGGSFRYVGKMKPVAEPEEKDEIDLLEFRLSDAVRLRKDREAADAGADE